MKARNQAENDQWMPRLYSATQFTRTRGKGITIANSIALLIESPVIAVNRGICKFEIEFVVQ